MVKTPAATVGYHAYHQYSIMLNDELNLQVRNNLQSYLSSLNIGTNIFYPKPFTEITDEDWFRFFEVNVMSGVRLSRHYFPGMIERNWGRIIFISSESMLVLSEPICLSSPPISPLMVLMSSLRTLIFLFSVTSWLMDDDLFL